MTRLSTLVSCLLLAGFGAAGCGASKTPEEIEAAKYPPVSPLSPERQARANELSKTRPPANRPPQ